MRRLRDSQEVDLHVGATRLRCRVVARAGDEAVLLPVGGALVGAQRPAGGPASLVFAHRGHVVELRGSTSWCAAAPDDLRFTVRDAVQLPQRRAAPRLRLPIDVVAAGAPARLVDLSVGGLALEGDGFGAAGASVEVALPLPDRAPPLTCRGAIVRCTPALTAVRLHGLSPDERQRIDRYVLAARRVEAARALAAAA